MAKHPTSYRLSGECMKLIEELAEGLGISHTAVIEQAVRKLGRAELPAAEGQKKPQKRKGQQ